jgi:hypothetical protein
MIPSALVAAPEQVAAKDQPDWEQEDGGDVADGYLCGLRPRVLCHLPARVSPF